VFSDGFCIITLMYTISLRHVFILGSMFHTEDRLCGLVVRVPGYGTELYCVSCEVRTEFIYVM
jgi:hypothetical protein